MKETCCPHWLRSCWLLLFLFLLLTASAAAGDLRPVERMLAEPVFGGEILVREAGQQHDRMILLVHGLGDEAGTTWDRVVPVLARDYHVVVPDLPGFGRSSKANLLYSPRQYALLLNWLISSFPAKPLTVVGHSLGGGIALIYAAEHGGNLQRLVLVDAVGLLHRLAVSQFFVKQQLQFDVPLVSGLLNGSLGRIADAVLEKSSRIPLDPDILLDNGMLRDKFLAAEPSRIAALALVQTDYSLLLGRITAPTWLLWGEHDQVANLRIADMLLWMLPRAEVRILANRGHSPMLEDAGEFNRILKQSLATPPRTFHLPKGENTGTDGGCDQQDGVLFQGNYKTLRISGCKNIRLVNVRAEQLLIRDSQVEIERSRIGTGGSLPALKALRSDIVATAVDLHGETAIVSEQSRFDLAGVRFLGAQTVVRAEGNPSSFLSSCSVKELSGTKTAIHLSRTLNAGDML